MISSSSVLEINLKNLIYNYKFLSKLNKGNITGSTIKANAYGLGDKKIIKILYNAGCKHFFVATLKEALELTKINTNCQLYVLNGIKKNEYIKILNKNNIIPIINSLENLKEVISLNKRISVGIHIDSGINRLGIPINKIKKIKINKKINIKLILSHFASADEFNNNYNNKQSIIFKKIINKYFNSITTSMNNSTSLLLNKKLHYDLARPGIALYGGHNNTKLKKNIKPVIKLKAEIIQIKNIDQNQYVGYNQTFRTKKNITVAILGIGYADGIKRLLSNKGYVYFKNIKFRIIGRISMDSITIDISKYAKSLKKGMYIDIINYHHDIEKMAKSCDTISNEILTSISNRVERIYKF